MYLLASSDYRDFLNSGYVISNSVSFFNVLFLLGVCLFSVLKIFNLKREMGRERRLPSACLLFTPQISAMARDGSG